MDRPTIAIYEHSAAEYARRRAGAHDPRPARSLARAVRRGGVRVDLGCGPGFDVEALGRPLVALDAAFAMVEHVRHDHDGTWAVQADLEALPFRRASLAGAWASKSYQHVPATRVPRALAHLHAALAPGAPFHLSLIEGEGEGVFANDDFPGRHFSLWSRPRLHDVLVGAGFELSSTSPSARGGWMRAKTTRALTLPDFVGPEMHVLVCGLNPSVTAARVGFGYAGATNRFWGAAVEAGLVRHPRDPLRCLDRDGVGMTDLVKRATSAASELKVAEYREGAGRVGRLVEWLRPAVVCFVGLAGYRSAVDRHARAGWQAQGFSDARAYVMPSTSGLNAATSRRELVEHLVHVARAGRS